MPSNSSSSSSSSSSMGCPCTSFLCNGPACIHLTSWTIYGANIDNTDNCSLHIICDVFGLQQQIEFYKDSLYSELVALAQGSIAGLLTISERNGSGISGTVTWDGTTIAYPSVSAISCYDFSSSSSTSSTSSIDSSSTSSLSRSSASSSSSNCCASPFCDGDGCSHFSSWVFSGSNDGNTDDCSIYVVFDYISASQQIRLYKGAAYTDQVCAGQWTGSNPIVLTERNSSGLSGTVVWDGTPVNFPSYAVLGCDVSSSSSRSVSSDSSSSLSSITSISTSSQSSSSSSSSSFSSSESMSSSSTSSSSSSSTSSLDSSSSSSESAGNTSSSSSSSLDRWNKSKPLLLATSAISLSGANRLAQTIYIDEDIYNIGKVYCYFYGPFGIDISYTIHMDIYSCNDDGSPSTSIFSGSIPGSTVTENGWYSFAVGISGSVPSNHYLSFVVWQQGGTEDNYVLWGYGSTSDTTRTIAWNSVDSGTTWTNQEELIRALKVIGSFNAYDLTDFRILTPPAEKEVFVQDLLDGTHDGTKLVPGSGYQYGVDKVVIDNPNAIISFVIDSSGSMGWNDRTNTRSQMVTSIIQRFKDNYPSDVIFDIVKFGAQSVNANSVTSNMGFPQYINLDLNNPTRKPFIFTVSNATASKNAVYSNNSYSFTVTEDFAATSSLICMSSGGSDPYDAGTLTKVSGGGDATIDYSEFRVSLVSDGIVSIGFKNFVDDHPYNIGEIIVGGTYQQEVGTKNWQGLLANGDFDFSVGNNGPKDESSLDLIGDPNLVFRRPSTVALLNTSRITTNALIGSSNIYINDVSLFTKGNKIDFVDVDSCSLGHTITNVNSVTSSLEITPVTTAPISSWVNGGGIAQDSNFTPPTIITGTAIQLLVRDVLATSNSILTFFIQTTDGTFLEWDFAPFNEWYVYNLYWLGDTAILPVDLYDTDGNPLPDGSMVEFYADQYPEDSSLSNQIIASLLIENAAIGSVKIYIESTDGYVVGTDIDVLNNKGEVQTVTITEVGEDIDGEYVKFDPALLYNFNTSDNAKIIKSITIEDQSNAASEISEFNMLSTSLAIIDVTPIETGRNLDSSLLKPYDVTPVAPSTTYEELNLDVARTKGITIDVPTIDGKAAVRVLPITEDNLKTISEKKEDASRLIFPARPPYYSDQLEQDSLDFTTTTTTGTTSTTTMMPTSEKDYALESPVYSQNGLAESSMISYATELEEKSFNISVPGVNNSSAYTQTTLMVRSYDIYTALVSKDSRGNTMARLYFKPFSVDFTPPIFIYSNAYGAISYFAKIESSDDTECSNPMTYYELKEINGMYAGNEYSIQYKITDKNIPLLAGSLNIRIYSNTVLDISDVLNTKGFSDSKQDLNVTYAQQVANINGSISSVTPLSSINQWRQDVENNPIGTIIESVNQDDQNSDTYVPEVVQQYADLVGGTFRERTSGSSFEYYTNPEQWTMATQYPGYYNYTIPIVNGEATLTIPASDINALLLVQASVFYGNNNKFEVIQSNLIYNGNPIDIGEISPNMINAQGGSTVYEMGTNVTWMGSPIADNVVVSFSPSDTPSLPAVSKTDGGWAGGVRIGPHDTVSMICPKNDCPCYGVVEDIDVTVSYLGYQRTVTRQIEWIGPIPDVFGDDKFYFYIEES